MKGRKGGGAKGAKAGGGKGGKKLARPARGRTLPSMWSLVKAAVLLGALAAFVFLLPFGGRTLADRWRASSGAEDFARRTWAEMKGAPDAEKPPAHRAPHGPARAGEATAGDRPVESHSDADRRALDKLVGEHLADGAKR